MAKQLMNLWLQLHELNAVLVKEVRQMVRSRLLLTVMGIELFALGITCFIFLVLAASDSSNDNSIPESGRYFFFFLIFILGTAQGLGAVDLLARTLKEREPGAVDLLFITTLTPGQIVRGKFWAGLGINLLVVALGLPFLALSYLLRGLDLLTILLGTVYLVSLALLLVASVLAIALLPMPNLFKKYGFGLAMIIGVLWMNTAVCVGLATTSPTWLEWKYAVVYLGIMATLLSGLGAMARFLLSAPTSDRSGWLRFVLLLCGLVWVLLIWFAAAQKSGHSGYEAVMAMGMFVLHALPVVGVALALFCSEAVQWRWRRQNPSQLPWLVFPFYEGTINGVAWCALVAATVIVGVFFGSMVFDNGGWMSRDAGHDYLTGGLLAYGYLFCYALTARAFCDWLQQRWQTFFSPILAFIVMLGGAGLLMVLVTIVHEAFDKHGEIAWPFLGNIMVFVWANQRDAYFFIHLATIVIWLGVLGAVFVMQGNRRRQVVAAR
jgi:ABC-type transport system involved in multi-copper enzyme maturation permease subunit